MSYWIVFKRGNPADGDFVSFILRPLALQYIPATSVAQILVVSSDNYTICHLMFPPLCNVSLSEPSCAVSFFIVCAFTDTLVYLFCCNDNFNCGEARHGLVYRTVPSLHFYAFPKYKLIVFIYVMLFCFVFLIFT